MVPSILRRLMAVPLLFAIAAASSSAPVAGSPAETKYCLRNAIAQGKTNAFEFCNVSTNIDQLHAQVLSLGTQVSTLEVQVEVLTQGQQLPREVAMVRAHG